MRTLAFVLILALALPAAAQEPGEFVPLHQVTFGLGMGGASESDVFNVVPDVKGDPDLFMNLAYLYHLSPKFGLGMSLIGYVQTITEVTVILNDGSTAQPEFTLSSLHFGAVGRYTFLEGKIKPYVFGMIALATGSVESEKTGSLSSLGFGAGGGAGLSFDIGSSVRLSLEGTGVFGSSSWKQKPFLNSLGTDFNPGMMALTANLSYLWSE